MNIQNINDSHVHITYSPVNGDFQPVYFDNFVSNFSKLYKKGKAIVFLNPIFKRLYKKTNHQYHVVDNADGKTVSFVSRNDSSVSYSGPDPYRSDNEQLILDCKNSDMIEPYIYLTISNNTMNDELAYFEKKHKGHFSGIKVHPNLCGRKLSEITNFNSNYPLIVHCGVFEHDDPKDVAKFAENYNGNVMFAHCARFDKTALSKIAKLDNAYIDLSPTYLLEDIVNGTTTKYATNDVPPEAKTSVSALVKYLISIVGADKLVFGSDYPWGDLESAKRLYDSLELDEETKQKIFQTNFERFNRKGCFNKSKQPQITK